MARNMTAMAGENGLGETPSWSRDISLARAQKNWQSPIPKGSIRRCAMSLDASWDDELEAGYVYLPDHPGAGTPGCVARSIDVFALDESLRGVQVILDVDDRNRVIGIEIVR